MVLTIAGWVVALSFFCLYFWEHGNKKYWLSRAEFWRHESKTWFERYRKEVSKWTLS